MPVQPLAISHQLCGVGRPVAPVCDSHNLVPNGCDKGVEYPQRFLLVDTRSNEMYSRTNNAWSSRGNQPHGGNFSLSCINASTTVRRVLNSAPRGRRHCSALSK